MKRNFCFCMLMSLILFGFSSTVVGQFGDPVPYHPQEMDGPVNMTRRSLFFSETDLAVPGRGLGINFTRHYDSTGMWRGVGIFSYASTLGKNWSHSYHWSILPSQKVVKIITGNGSIKIFNVTTSNKFWYSVPAMTTWNQHWEGTRPKFTPTTGVRASLALEKSGTEWAFIYTARNGTRYKFEAIEDLIPNRAWLIHLDYVLTEIADPNGNKIKLHYETRPENTYFAIPRLAAVEDPLGRILKFHYGLRANNRDYPRYITKVEFGLGTKTALTTVYNTVQYSYTYESFRNGYYWTFPATYYKVVLLTAAAQQLGSSDPRGSVLKTKYEYATTPKKNNAVYLAAIVAPEGNRTEFDVDTHWHRIEKVRVEEAANSDGTDGDVLYQRTYKKASFSSATHDAHDGAPQNSKRYFSYTVLGGQVTKLYQRSAPLNSRYWTYSNRNVTYAYYHDNTDRHRKWMYRIHHSGSNEKNNRQMGNVTKVEQQNPDMPVHVSSDAAVYRKWEADYETKYNRPIWQIDSMGHKTEFTYDTKGNLTEKRSKANTGTQPHAVDHDIITTHAYDSYGNRTTTTFMPDTSQEKAVTTVYDSTKHTYPIEVKTTVTVDGTAHTIKTKSEWDVNRGLKTADIDAQGKRTEYAYWQDRKLKYTRRVADNMYTVPTYDKNGNVTQTQVRKGNWQTGTLIAQTKTEYDGMNRAVKAHSFNDNWTTPYATTQTVYDAYGDVSETKDPRNLKTTYTRDSMGRVTKQTLPDGDWVETRYNSLHQITKAWTSANGSETSPAVSNTYDRFNRFSQVSYSTGESVSNTYDLGDNVLTQQTNDGTNTYTYTYTHDQLNRVITQNNSLLGYKTFYEYDDASMRKRMYIQPSAGGTTLYDVNYAYDEANRLLSVTDALAAKTASYGYFDIGALKTVTNPNGITTHRTLDSLNRLSTLTYKKTATADLSSLTYTYDDKSNVTQLVRDDTGAGGTSKTFEFCYDNLSRLTKANYGDGIVIYTYDKSGNRLNQVSSVDGTTNYTVATDSNQLTYRSLVPEDTDFSTMNYTYDGEGKLTQRSEGTDSDAFTYGFGSQLTQIQKTRNNTVTQTISYAYDGSGKRVKVTDSRGTRYFLYDGLMPVLELDAQKNITASYFYGGNGVVYRRKHNAVAHWHFDEGTGTVAHDVDGSQNGTLGGGTENKKPAWSTENGGSLLFDGTNDVLKVADSDALDLVGNTLTISCWVKRSSAASGYLVKKSDTSNGYRLWITSTGAVQFDVLLSGTTKTVTSATTIPLNTWKHVAARYNGSELRVFIGGAIETATTASTGSLAATTEALWMGYYDSTNHQLNGYLDDVSIYDTALSDAEITKLSNNQMGRYEYHHTNALGSNIVLTDDTKNVLVRYEYDVFGAVRSEVGASDNTRKFTGKEYETDVKLYYFAARYYDPHIGRFTQRDPIGDGINWYAYVDNNPLAFIDPTGLRRLSATEKEKAKKFFGDIIDWDKVDIRDKHFFSSALSKKKMAMTVNNTIFGKNMSDDLLIHELVHVWQFQQERIEPVSAGAVHVIFTVTGQRKELYQYKLDPLGDPDRKRFQDYSFEEQAAILQDAYLVLFTEFGKPINNKIFNLGSQPVTDTMKEHYQFLVDEFKQWHDELNSSDTQP